MPVVILIPSQGTCGASWTSARTWGIENLNRQIRKTIKTRGHFPDEQAATELVALAIQRAETKWRSVPGPIKVIEQCRPASDR